MNCKVLELYEKCEMNSFLEIEKPYRGGCMELSDNNICGMLRFSVYYNDIRIMRLCKKYLKNHMSESIMIEMFYVLNGSNISGLNDIRDMCEDYMKVNSYKYLSDDSLLKKLSLESIKFIFNSKNLIIKSESWLLNRLLRWFKIVLKESKENEEEVNDFINLIESKIPLNEIKKEEIEEENLSILKELDIEILDEITDFVCVDMDDVRNNELIKLVHKYYPNDDEIKLDENEINMLYKEEIKLVIIILNVILEMRMAKIIPNEIKSKELSRLISEYNQNKKSRIIKCLCLFIKKKYISIIECLCGKKIQKIM